MAAKALMAAIRAGGNGSLTFPESKKNFVMPFVVISKLAVEESTPRFEINA